MSIRIVVTWLLTLAACLHAGWGSPSGARARSSFELSAPATSSVRTARVLARYGEAAAAYDLLRVSRGAPPVDVAFECRLLAETGRFAAAESLLSEHTPLVDEDDVRDHYLRRAALAFHAGRYARALDALALAESPGGVDFTAYRDFIAMRSHLALGDAAEAVSLGDAGRARGVPEALESAYDEALVEALQSAGEVERAIALVGEVKGRTRGSMGRARLLHLEYEVYARAGLIDGARSVAMELVTEYPLYGDATAVVDEVVASVSMERLSVRELASFAGQFTRSARPQEARRLLGEMDARALSRHEREQRRILKAELVYREGQYAAAASLAAPAFADESFKRQSVLILARAYRRSDRERRAAALYEHYASAFPNDDKAAEALFVAAHIYERSGDDAGLKRALDRLVKSYSSSYYGHTAALMAAARHTRRGEHRRAAEVLLALVRRSQGGDEAALYYLSEAYRSSGDSASSEKTLNQLRAVDSASFYLNPRVPARYRAPVTGSTGALSIEGDDGLLSLVERGARARSAAHARLQSEFASNADPTADEDYAGALQRARWFFDAGLREWGEGELDTARRKCYDSPTRMLELASVCDAYGLPWQSVVLYQRIRGHLPQNRRADFADDFRWLLYPTPYPLQILENSARHGVSPHLAYAMIREESRFDRGAVSRVGALGLMQIMPETARWVAGQLELPGWAERDLLDPEVNVAFGMWYAASLLEESGGDPLRMLAAYNAGSGNARRWFGDTGAAASPIRAVDGIDYRETREYVQRIVESANIYHSLYFAPDSPGQER